MDSNCPKMDCFLALTARPTINPPGITKKAARWKLRPQRRRLRLNQTPSPALRTLNHLRQTTVGAKVLKRAAIRADTRRRAERVLQAGADRSPRRCCRRMLLMIFHCNIRDQSFNY